jgi:hypothetical protein
MKTLCKFCLAVMLTLTVTTTAFAGDIHTTVTEPEPTATPATTEGDMHTGVAGYIPNGGSEAAATDDSVAAGVVALVQSVLSLL